MRILWLTTCAPDMWQASGRHLVDSFLRTRSDGSLLVLYEGPVPLPPLPSGKVVFRPLDTSNFLSCWLAKHADFIPEHLGGRLPEPLCRCVGGPYEPHDRRHQMPCPGHWFNKNHSRWFRKVAALQVAGELHFQNNRDQYDAIIWVDSDCVFKRMVPAKIVASWFVGNRACFYLKSKRPVIEAGVVGYWPTRGADRLLACVFDRYWSGRYRLDKRWDDSYQLQEAIAETKVPAGDLAHGVGPHAAVVEHSALSAYLKHSKGKHGRGLGLMT